MVLRQHHPMVELGDRIQRQLLLLVPPLQDGTVGMLHQNQLSAQREGSAERKVLTATQVMSVDSNAGTTVTAL